MIRRRKPKVGGKRIGAGRPPSPNSRPIPRMVRLTQAEADAHDAARGPRPWADWMRAAAELLIARGTTR